jgi:hypothetical protein
MFNKRDGALNLAGIDLKAALNGKLYRAALTERFHFRLVAAFGKSRMRTPCFVSSCALTERQARVTNCHFLAIASTLATASISSGAHHDG